MTFCYFKETSYEHTFHTIVFHVLESLKLDRDTIKLTVNFVLTK